MSTLPQNGLVFCPLMQFCPSVGIVLWLSVEYRISFSTHGWQMNTSKIITCWRYLFIYLGFYVAFNTVQVISRRVVGRAEETKYIQFVRVLYCKLPTNSKVLPAFPLEAVTGTEPRPQWREERVLPLCHHGPSGGGNTCSPR